MMVEHGGLQLRDVVRDAVSFAVVHDYAPAEEQRVLDALLNDPDDERVVRRLRRQRSHGDPLGFGIGEIAAVLGPMLMMSVEESFRAVVGGAAGALLTSWLQRVFRRPPVAVNLHELPREQVRAVHDLIVEKLVESQIAEEAARAVAERIAGRLALGADDDSNGPAAGQ
ncbi:hypothetical protein [Streptomyces sp. NPDC003032]